MAERRMFAKTIIDSDAFIDMPTSARLLYYDLGMRAYDKGIVNNVFSIARSVGCTKDDVECLIANGFIKPLVEYGTFEIVHWYENNGIGETAKKRNNYKYRQWRLSIINRDGKCMVCGSKENLQAHHIKPFSTHPLERYDERNGLTLCETCHKKLHRRNTYG